MGRSILFLLMHDHFNAQSSFASMSVIEQAAGPWVTMRQGPALACSGVP